MKSEKGQLLSMHAIMMVTILAITGFIYDAGAVYIGKQKTQLIIREAIIVGTKYLPDDSDKALSEVNSFIIASSENPANFNIHLRSDHRAIAIEKNSTVDTVFWKVVGIKKLYYKNEEMAFVNENEIDVLEGLIPVAIDVSYFGGYSANQTYQLPVSPYTALSIARYYSDSNGNTGSQIEEGYQTPVYLDETLTKKPGMSKGYLNNFRDRIEANPIVYMPVVSYSSSYGEILGFVKFEVIDIFKNSSSLYLEGEFLGQSMDYQQLTTDIAPFYIYNRKFVKNILPEQRWY